MGSCYNPRSTVQGESFTGANRHQKAALISGSTAKIVWSEKDRIGWQHRRGDETFLVVGMVPLIKKQPGPVAKPVRVPVTRPAFRSAWGFDLIEGYRSRLAGSLFSR